MESVDSWVAHLVSLIQAFGAERLSEVLRLISGAPSHAHVDALDAKLKVGNWYGRLAPELLKAVRMRQEAFRAAELDDDLSL